MKTVNLFSHFRHPSGLWFRVCGDRCQTLKVSFSRLRDADERAK